MVRGQKITIAVLAVLSVVFVLARIMLSEPVPPDPPTVRPAMPSAEVAKPAKVEEPPAPAPAPPPPPPPVDLSPGAARRLAAQRVDVVPIEDEARLPHLRPGQGYAEVEVAFSDSAGLAPFFLEFFDKDVGTIDLSATLALDDGRRFAPVPVLLLGRWLGGRVEDFETVFAAADRALAPRFRVNRAAGLSVSFAVAYGPGNRHRQRKKTISDLLSIAIPLRDGGGEAARRVAFRDAAGVALGAVEVHVRVRPSLLADDDFAAFDFSRLMAAPPGEHFSGRGDLFAAVIIADGADLGAACGALVADLTESMGLSAFDAAVVLWTLAGARDALGAAGDYASDCLGAGVTTALADAGLELPPPLPAKRAKGAVGRYNAAFNRMATGLRSGAPEKFREAVADLFAATVTLSDPGRVWLTDDGGRVIRAGVADIAPAAGRLRAADHLLDLPVAHFACYGSAGDRRGRRRTALLQLSNDAGLWLLEAAFDGSHRIAGLTLAPVEQERACQHVGGRIGGCYFTTSGKTYRGIDFTRCR